MPSLFISVCSCCLCQAIGNFHQRFERTDEEGETCDDHWMNLEVVASLVLAGAAGLGVLYETALVSSRLRAVEAAAAAMAIPMLLYAQIKLFKDVIYRGDVFLWFRSSTAAGNLGIFGSGQIIVIRIFIIQACHIALACVCPQKRG